MTSGLAGSVAVVGVAAQPSAAASAPRRRSAAVKATPLTALGPTPPPIGMFWSAEPWMCSTETGWAGRHGDTPGGGLHADGGDLVGQLTGQPVGEDAAVRVPGGEHPAWGRRVLRLRQLVESGRTKDVVDACFTAGPQQAPPFQVRAGAAGAGAHPSG